MNRLAAIHDWPLFIVRRDSCIDGRVEIGRRHDDEGITAAKFEQGALDVLAGRGRHTLTGGFGAGEGGSTDPVVIQDSFDHVRADQQGAEGVFGKTGLLEDIVNGQCRARHIGRMFEQPGIARHQGWRCESENLPEGEVPRHHGQHRAEWQVAHKALARFGLDGSVGKIPLGMAGIVTADRCALLDFGNGAGQRLAHFFGKHSPVVVGFGFKQIGYLVHALSARVETHGLELRVGVL